MTTCPKCHAHTFTRRVRYQLSEVLEDYCVMCGWCRPRVVIPFLGDMYTPDPVSAKAQHDVRLAWLSELASKGGKATRGKKHGALTGPYKHKGVVDSSNDL